MKRGFSLVLIMALVIFGLSMSATAQKGKLFKGVDWRSMADAAKAGKTSPDQSIIDIVNRAYNEKVPASEDAVSANPTGTWYVTVPGETPESTFYAYHTFGQEGTFVETSSLLATLTEGPAHGVWERRMGGFVLTFELFAFDPESRAQVGRVRVRNFIVMEDRSNFTSNSVVDFIELDGTVIPNIGAGPYSATRVQLRSIY